MTLKSIPRTQQDAHSECRAASTLFLSDLIANPDMILRITFQSNGNIKNNHIQTSEKITGTCNNPNLDLVNINAQNLVKFYPFVLDINQGQ